MFKIVFTLYFVVSFCEPAKGALFFETTTYPNQYSCKSKAARCVYYKFCQLPLSRFTCPQQHVCCPEHKIGLETTKKTPTTAPELESKIDLLNANCTSSTYSGFMRGGSQVSRGAFPFLAALVKASTVEFFCGGSLITEKHVLTAAHCIHEKHSSKKRDHDDVLVLLGRHNLALRAERHSETRSVDRIIIHEDWKNYTDKYDADLAILVMDRSVIFSRWIRPVCITSDQTALSSSIGSAGWGGSDSDAAHENIPKVATVRPISDGKCFEDQGDMHPIYSSRMFCAKGDNASPCVGDSGGSFFVKYNKHYVATGIVSVGDTDCDVDKYMLYTKLSDFVAWIRDAIE